MMTERQAHELAQRADDAVFALELLARLPLVTGPIDGLNLGQPSLADLLALATFAPHATDHDVPALERGLRVLELAALPIAISGRELALLRVRALHQMPGEN